MKAIVNCATGITTYEQETPEELAQMAADQKEYAKRELDQAWVKMRVDRNAKLSACDWTQVSDAPLTDEQRQAWRTYRQALRDLPQSVFNPQFINWPEIQA